MRTISMCAAHWIVVDASPVTVKLNTPFEKEVFKRRVLGEPEVSDVQFVTPPVTVPASPLTRN